MKYQLYSDKWISDKPIVLYDIGSRESISILDKIVANGHKVIAVVNAASLKMSEIIQEKYWNYTIWNGEELIANQDNINVVVGSYENNKIKQACEILAEIGEFSVCGMRSLACFDWFFDSNKVFDESKIQYVYDHLEDEQSKATLLGIKNFKLTKKAKFLEEIECKEECYFISHPMFKLHDREVFIDGGTFIGDTILRFIEVSNGKYDYIYGFEPNEISYATAEALIKLQGNSNIEISQSGLYNRSTELIFMDMSNNHEGGRIYDDEKLSDIACAVKVPVVSLDDYLAKSEHKVTYLKLDVEGSEEAALDGAKKIITCDHPRLAVCSYHKMCDFYEIPYKIMMEYPEYHVALRHHSSNTVDTICYAWI